MNLLRFHSLVLKNIFKTKKKILEYYARLSQKALNVILETKNSKTRKGQKRYGSTRKLNSFKKANSFLFDKGRIVRRLRERLKIRKRAIARLFQGVVLIKKGNTIIRQYLKPQMSLQGSRRASLPRSAGKKLNQSKKNEMNTESQYKSVGLQKNSPSRRDSSTPVKTSVILNISRSQSGSQSLRGSTKPSVGKKKFLSLLSSKFDNNFLKTLKQLLTKSSTTLAKHREKQLQTYGFLKYAPLGFNRFWSLNNINKFKQKPKSTIYKLIRLIEQKAFAYLVSLRKDYKLNGGLSFSKVFAYYQIIRFLKKLKQFGRNFTESTLSNKVVPMVPRRDFTNSRENNIKKNTAIETTLKRKLQNIENECKKTKFITYLQQLVQKHRERNIYQYLRTISESRRSLKTLKQFVLTESNALFGVDLQNTVLTPETTEEIKSNMKSLFVKPASRISGNISPSLEAIFAEGQHNALRAIEKEMQMHQRNVALIPKITIKFFNVKPSIVANRPLDSKASFLALSIVDQLEKRKAFRKVIKDAKQNSMKHPIIKGIKIQVSGRLNGAEIARSEWVRAGRVPLQTLRANIDYSYKTAKTIYGIIGVRIWIFKGYTR